MDFMKSLLCGEKILEMIPVQTRYGRCILYFTNLIMTLEGITKGLVLELGYESVLSLQPIDKRSLKLTWAENNSTYDLNINYETPEDLANRFKKIQNNYINSLRKMEIKIEELTT